MFKLHCNENGKVYLHRVLFMMIYLNTNWKIHAASVLRKDNSEADIPL